ncbi:hypothetical protein C8R44DRAFT_562025, partial [Mycena epipterygia]
QDDQEEADDSATVLPEKMHLSLPSNLKKGRMASDLYSTLRTQEATIREGQINESLRKLRMALGDKAWMLRNNVRDASGGKGKLRAWSGVNQKDKEVRKCLKVYGQATAALHRMGMGEKWKPITKDDLKMSGDMTEANRTGQRSSTLAWFWRLEDDGATGEMQESSQMSEFYRVNWLRAKARVARWIEEKKFVTNEMIWTVNSFAYYRDMWKDRATVNPSEQGLKAYAEKQVDLWERFALNGQEMFDWARS